MKTYLIVSIIFTMFAGSCEKNDRNTPDCIKQLLAGGEVPGLCDEGASLSQYVFQGDTVYVVDPGKCGADMTSAVYDDECHIIGMLGGITGNTKINGVDFDREAVFVKKVWQD